MYFLVLRRLIIFQCSETSFIHHTDVKVGSHGPQAAPTWVHPKVRVVLLGDTCHPMLVRMP